MRVFILLFTVLILQISNAQSCLNVDYKLRGYFYAGSAQEDPDAFGGHYVDENKPKMISASIQNIMEEGKLQILVNTDESIEHVTGIKGLKVFVVNTSDTLVKLPAQDSRLYLKRQVFYRNKWRDIEYLPSSWCGNSYHSVFIEPKQFWEFSAPCLEGKIEAKFRFSLYINEELTVYSTEFNGSFNRSQLRKEQGYTSTGLMDPYDH